MKRKPVFGAFNQGQLPTIACFNKATVDLGVDFDELLVALQVYVTEHMAPIWGTPAQLLKTTDFMKDAWAMVFLDYADAPGALAYHDLTPEGLPLSKVFVKTILKAKEQVSVAASHELSEMLVDPAINMMTTGPNLRTMYAYESCDPVEAYSFPINGIEMSDFVYPSYFEAFRKAGSVPFDHMQKVTKPFQILPGGYQIIFRGGRWREIFGSTVKQRRFAKEDRRGHRSTRRGKRPIMTRG
jgi:hypothetical protein